MENKSTSLERGAAVILAAVKTLGSGPGVYRMLNVRGDVLYVGKAKSLKKRVMSYTATHRLPHRLQRMVAETTRMEFVSTHTEVEALLLEANLIKRLEPRYNILLKDSKFFASLLLTDHAWPRLMKHRGAKTAGGRYFGPFASTDAVNQALTTLLRLFRLRSCSDSFFAARTRPCLQYHIKRCSAPCVDYITQEAYRASLDQAVAFLEGRARDVQVQIAEMMEAASAAQEYERAAALRDQLQALTQLQAQQTINVEGMKDADIIALARVGGVTCVQIFFFRSGSNYGSHSFFPAHVGEMSLEEACAAFLSLFYTDTSPPREILLSHAPVEATVIEDALSETAGHRVHLSTPQRGPRHKIVLHALQNAEDALARHIATSETQRKTFGLLREVFDLERVPQRIEVYDNSHLQGTNAIGAMIVAGVEGFEKAAYRKFTIKNSTPGDDFGMMREVLTRRFGGSLTIKDEGVLPDLLLIDGGLGQLNAVLTVLDELNVAVPVVAIAKGPDRNAGRETFYMRGRDPFTLENQKSVLYLLQRLRDEAHRFAITFHRQKRAKASVGSSLDGVPGIGPSRKRALLAQFGSVQAIARAGVDDLKMVKGMSAKLAQKIYDYFQER